MKKTEKSLCLLLKNDTAPVMNGRKAEDLKFDSDYKQALKLRDEFLSIASHELKTPLTSLSLQIQILKFNLLKNNPRMLTKEELLQFLNKMDIQVLRLARLVEDMLDISRIDCGNFIPILRPVDLETLIYNVVERLAPQFNVAGCNIKICPMQKIVGIWDSYRIEQVIVNLISNAIKYGAKKPILIEVLKKNETAIIHVKDYGIGIAKENQQRIFNRFERAVSAKGVTGLGLGLYIVKKILAAHQGSISLESDVGQGSTFTVELPLVSKLASSPLSRKDLNYEFNS